MVAINFSAQFADAVESGAKLQTIRAPRKDGRLPAPGVALQLYTGMRSKSCRKLRDAVCTAVTPVRIKGAEMWLDGKLLDVDAHNRQAAGSDGAFARRDGFDSYSDMAEWFRARYGLPFDGFVVEWK